jgi:hypothetical protein
MLLLTFASLYIKKTAGLSVMCLNMYMLRVQCILCSMSMKICVLYPNVDELLAGEKEIFVKSVARIELFENESSRCTTPSSSSNYTQGIWLDWISLCITQKTLKSIVLL